jgi:hypothetical protein
MRKETGNSFVIRHSCFVIVPPFSHPGLKRCQIAAAISRAAGT